MALPTDSKCPFTYKHSTTSLSKRKRDLLLADFAVIDSDTIDYECDRNGEYGGDEKPAAGKPAAKNKKKKYDEHEHCVCESNACQQKCATSFTVPVINADKGAWDPAKVVRDRVVSVHDASARIAAVVDGASPVLKGSAIDLLRKLGDAFRVQRSGSRLEACVDLKEEKKQKKRSKQRKLSAAELATEFDTSEFGGGPVNVSFAGLELDKSGSGPFVRVNPKSTLRDWILGIRELANRTCVDSRWVQCQRSFRSSGNVIVDPHRVYKAAAAATSANERLRLVSMFETNRLSLISMLPSGALFRGFEPSKYIKDMWHVSMKFGPGDETATATDRSDYAVGSNDGRSAACGADPSFTTDKLSRSLPARIAEKTAKGVSCDEDGTHGFEPALVGDIFAVFGTTLPTIEQPINAPMSRAVILEEEDADTDIVKARRPSQAELELCFDISQFRGQPVAIRLFENDYGVAADIPLFEQTSLRDLLSAFYGFSTCVLSPWDGPSSVMQVPAASVYPSIPASAHTNTLRLELAMRFESGRMQMRELYYAGVLFRGRFEKPIWDDDAGTWVVYIAGVGKLGPRVSE